MDCNEILLCPDWDEEVTNVCELLITEGIESGITGTVELGNAFNIQYWVLSGFASITWTVLDLDNNIVIPSFTVPNGGVPSGTNVVGGSWYNPIVQIPANSRCDLKINILILDNCGNNFTCEGETTNFGAFIVCPDDGTPIICDGECLTC